MTKDTTAAIQQLDHAVEDLWNVHTQLNYANPDVVVLLSIVIENACRGFAAVKNALEEGQSWPR